MRIENLDAALDAAVLAESPGAVALRHALHREPELSRAEHRTTARLEAALADVVCRTRRGPDGVGLIVDLGPEGPRPCLRADIDALALDEVTGVPFSSCVPGVMHACGHDVHTAVVLATLRTLAKVAPKRPFRFLFQPAEEATPGGSLDLIRVGALTDVFAALTLHCDPTRPLGRVGLQAGPLTAAADVFEVTLRGRGGHGARPHETDDLVLAACQLVSQLPHPFHREVDARVPHSISIGAFHAGGTSANVLPAQARFAGTLRTPSREVRARSEATFRRIIEATRLAWSIEIELELRKGAPPVVNDPALVEVLRGACETVLGADAIDPPGLPSMGAEDFAWYLDHVPGVLLRLGTGLGAPLHSPRFTADDGAIPLAARILARAMLSLSPTP